MGYFPATIKAILQGRKVKRGILVEFLFDPTPAYFWNGSGSLVAGGKTWVGLRQLGRIEGVEEALQHRSSQMRLTLSGADLTADVVQIAAAEDRAGYVGKLVRIWLQFFNDDWSLLDTPYAVAAGIMDGMPIERQPAGKSGTVRSITVTAENIFYNRRVASNGYFTDSDQQERFPGDLGLQFIPSLQDKTIAVPW